LTVDSEREGTVDSIASELIDAGPNDRERFVDAEIEHLASSISTHGLAQPPTLRPRADGRFEIVAGERRIRAMRDVLGWTEIPAMVRVMDDEAAAAIMLVENVQRVDLDPMEEARGYASRMDRFGYSQAELARQASVPPDRVRRRLALLALAPEVARLVSLRQLPLAYASSMCPLDRERQSLALRAYQSGPMRAEAFAVVCERLLAEQSQESMFSGDDFLRVEEYVLEAVTAVNEGTTVDEVDADPVGTKDIATRLGVKAQTVAQWRQRGLLPTPRWEVSGMAVWQWSDIEAWARDSGRLS
jgi:ParB/RepB/Spo0J family partition protein